MTPARISIIGCGNMGRSLAGGLLGRGWTAPDLRCAEPDAGQRKIIETRLGLRPSADANEIIEGARAVIFAVKPHHLREAVSAAAPALREQRPLVISIAAGVRLDTLGAWLEAELPLVRAMPNTPALIGEGATALCANPVAGKAERDLAEKVLGAVGMTVWVENEDLLDAVTALSGSGPAYFFLLMEALEAAGISMGLGPGQSRALTLATALGAARMAREGKVDPAELRRQVTSPGGTTERALGILQQADLLKLVERAVHAGRDRATEMARQAAEG